MTKIELIQACGYFIGDDTVDVMLSHNIPLPTVVDAAIKQAFMEEDIDCCEAQSLRQAVTNLNTLGRFNFEGS